MNTRWTHVLVIVATVWLTVLLPAQAATINADAQIVFHGSSTLHDFEGTVTAPPFHVELQQVGGEERVTVKADAVVKVGAMTTDNRKRDKNMFRMFDLEHYALIEGSLPETVISVKEPTKVKLLLKIRNEQHEVEATISDVRLDGNKMSCRMTFAVSLQSFHLKAPSVMGVIRVDDTVQVECTIKSAAEKSADGKAAA